MAQNVHLHGGPMHDTKIAIADGVDHLNILAAEMTAQDFVESEVPIESIPLKKGSYSRVRQTTDFEWDGWRTHE